jgi:hypothetical protein
MLTLEAIYNGHAGKGVSPRVSWASVHIHPISPNTTSAAMSTP